VAGDGLVDAAARRQRGGQVAVNTRQARVELQRPAITGDGLVVPVELREHVAQFAMGPRDARIDLDGAAQKRKGRVRRAVEADRRADRGERPGHRGGAGVGLPPGLQHGASLEGRDPTPGVPHLHLQQPEVVVRLGDVRLEREGLAKGVHGLREPPGTAKRSPEVHVEHGLAGLRRRRPREHRDGLVEPSRPRAEHAEEKGCLRVARVAQEHLSIEVLRVRQRAALVVPHGRLQQGHEVIRHDVSPIVPDAPIVPEQKTPARKVVPSADAAAPSRRVP
jgi:hypothetical protein